MTDIQYSNKLWEAVCVELKRLFPSDVYDMWFSELICETKSEDTLVLKVPNEFNAIWIENNYLDFIQQQIRFISGAPVDVSLEIIETPSDEAIVEDIPAQTNNNYSNRLNENRLHSKIPNQLKPTFLNPKKHL